MDEDLLSDADLWEKKVREGMPEGQATAYVEARRLKQKKAQAQSPAAALGGVAERASRSIAERMNPAGMDNVMQGQSLGFADDLRAAVQSIPSLLPGGESPREAFRRNLAEENAPLEQYREEHKVGGIAGQLMGGVAGAAVLGPATAAAGASRALQAARALARRPVSGGAALGAAAAVGESQGGVAERAGAAVPGAIAGAATGGALRVAQPAASKFATTAADLIPGVRDKLAPALQRVTAPMRQGAIPEGAEPRHTGGFFDRLRGRSGILGAEDAGPILTDEQRANDLLLDALQADDLPLEELQRRVEAARGPISLLDVGGENTLGVARGARTVQGSRAKDVLPSAVGGRVRGQEERVLGYLLEDTGLGQRTNILGTLDEIADARSQEADQLYGAIRDKVVNNPRLSAALQRPAFRKAYEIAQEIRENQIAQSLLSGDEAQGALPPLEDILEGRAALTLGTLDQIKRGLDDVIYNAKREGLGKQRVGSLEGVRHEFVRLLDKAVPGYEKARSAFAGKVAMEEALLEGQNLFKMQPEQARRLLGEMGDSEREAFRKGALEALAERIEGTSNRFDLTSRRPLDDVTLDRQRLRLLFDDDAGFERFKAALEEEARMAATNRFVTGGSNTADKLAELANIAGVDLGDIMQAAGGNFAQPAVKLLDRMGRKAVRGFTRRNADALAPKLTAGIQSRDDLFALLRELAEAEKRRQGSRQRQEVVREGASVAAGLAAGR